MPGRHYDASVLYAHSSGEGFLGNHVVIIAGSTSCGYRSVLSCGEIRDVCRNVADVLHEHPCCRRN